MPHCGSIILVHAAVRHNTGATRSCRSQGPDVARIIKRYGSRKLYDTSESRYVSLEEIGDWVRSGEKIKVVDNESQEDVTAQTLTQVILDEGKRGISSMSSDFLHDLIRRGEQVVSRSVQSVQDGMDRLLHASIDRVPPLRHVRDETDALRQRLEALERALANLERTRAPRSAAAKNVATARRTAEATRRPRKKGA
jgi:polyhydroxyalkanoate synthesis repressor PhaR